MGRFVAKKAVVCPFLTQNSSMTIYLVCNLQCGISLIEFISYTIKLKGRETQFQWKRFRKDRIFIRFCLVLSGSFGRASQNPGLLVRNRTTRLRDGVRHDANLYVYRFTKTFPTASTTHGHYRINILSLPNFLH